MLLSLLSYFAQILCLAEQIQFTDRCEAAIKSNSLQEFQIEMESRVLELKLKALILDTIHAIDVVQQLIKHGVKSLEDWIWQKQLRFYMQKQRGLLSNESCHWFSHNCGTKKLLSPTRGIESHAFGTSMLYHRTLLSPLIQAVYRKPVVYDLEIALLTSEFSVVQWGTRMFFFFPS